MKSIIIVGKQVTVSMTRVLALCLSLFVLIGCNANDLKGDNDAQLPICLSSSIEVQGPTRAAFPQTNTQIVNGRQVAVFVDNDKGSQLYGNEVFTSNGIGGLSGNNMFFPISGNVDIYAFHTNATMNGTFPASAVSHTVSADQTTLADYVSSDLLYATRRDVVKTTGNVQLSFYHMLSKMRIALVAGAGLPNLTGAVLTIENTKPQAQFSPSKTANMTTSAARAAMISAAGTTSAIQVSSDISTNLGTGIQYNEAIIVPQSITTGATLFKLRLSTGKELEWKTTGDMSFESGKIYTYNITVNASTLSVSTTVSDWENGQLGWKEKLYEQEISVVKIHAGTFLMGSSDGTNIGNIDGTGLNTTPREPNRENDETQHKVTLTQDFYMSRYEITVSQYAAFLNANSIGSDGIWAGAKEPTMALVVDADDLSHNCRVIWKNNKWEPYPGNGKCPIMNVTWYGAIEYAKWIGGSLPTEAQWEYACRAGEDNRPFGIGTGFELNSTNAYFNWEHSWSWDGISENSVRTSTGISDAEPKAVGSYAPNAWGLYDMHGNASEWCLDRRNRLENNYLTLPATDPLGTEGSLCVRRGSYLGYGCRSAARSFQMPTFAGTPGFRVVFVL